MQQIETPAAHEFTVEVLNAEQLKLAASILYMAYHDDPLLMQIFRFEQTDYEKRLRSAIREDLAAFWDAGQPILGLMHGEQLLGVACITTPSSALSGDRFWHWRLKMLLTAGLLSTRQMLEKEQKIHAAMPAKRYHMLAFLARNPAYHQPAAMRTFLQAIDHWVDLEPESEGIGVFVTLEKNLPLFHQDDYQKVCTLEFQTVSGTLLFRPKQVVT
ncbi:MAG: GNAT family N-acetyltransferase [Rheinheimera sp.]